MQNNSILINRIFPTSGFNKYIKNILLIIFGSVLLTISAKIQVPFWPVPMTMQTFMVFLIGATYGVRLSFLTLVAYLFEGAIGLPVFAAGGGIVYLTGPTAGYLYGMTLAAVVVSYYADRGFSLSYIKTFISIILSSIIIFTFGVIYLGSIIGYDKALAGGLYPFIPSEFFKIGLAVILIQSITKYISK